MRFYPQSFELSTLGGWIATRAGGHFATGATHVDDLVEAVRAITPTGTWESRRLPGLGRRPLARPAAARLGGDPRRHHRGVGARAAAPAHRAWRAVRFASFLAGAEAVRALVQAGLRPANCRLIDALEAAQSRRGRREQRGARARLRVDRPSRRRRPRARPRAVPRARRRARRAGGAARGAGAWREAFLRMPYLRDMLVRLGVLSDTFETAITWERLPGLPRGGRRRHARGAGRALPRDLPLHARLPRRPRAVLHGPRAGAPRRRARAVAGDEERGVRRDPRRRRHDHPPSRRRAAITARGTTPSARTRSPPRCGRPRRRSTPRAILNPGVLLDP